MHDISFQLKQLGHSVDKVEFIVMGGTFMALSQEYRDYFIRNLHDALSGHTSNDVQEAVKSVYHLSSTILLLQKSYVQKCTQSYTGFCLLATGAQALVRIQILQFN